MKIQYCIKPLMPFLEYLLTSLPSPLKGERQFDFLIERV